MATEDRVLAICIEDVIVHYDDTLANCFPDLETKGLPDEKVMISEEELANKINYIGLSGSRWQAFFKALQTLATVTDEKDEKKTVRTHIALFFRSPDHVKPGLRGYSPQNNLEYKLKTAIAKQVAKLVGNNTIVLRFSPNTPTKGIYGAIENKCREKITKEQKDFSLTSNDVFLLDEKGLNTLKPNVILKKGEDEIHEEAEFVFPKRTTSYGKTTVGIEETNTLRCMKNVLSIFKALPKINSPLDRVLNASITNLPHYLNRFKIALGALEKQRKKLTREKELIKLKILDDAIIAYQTLLTDFDLPKSDDAQALKTAQPGNGNDFYQRFLTINQKHYNENNKKALAFERGWGNAIANFMINAVFVVGTGIVLGAAVLAKYGIFRPFKAKSLTYMEDLQYTMDKTAREQGYPNEFQSLLAPS